METNNSEDKENSIDDAPSSIGEVITQLTSFYKTAIKLFVIYLGGAFLIISILDEVLDFDEYESFTLNGIEYETPRKNSPSEEFESYDKTKEEYFDVNNVSFYGRNKDSIPIIIFLLGFGLVLRGFYLDNIDKMGTSDDDNHPA